ncbi:MAG: hypothetical protein JJU12_05245 [Chlamydiales bacterium]|nr:hypothetical protein [Chlamydiales bacterium]
MIIYELAELCPPPRNVRITLETRRQTAFILDGIASITILVLGILAISGTLPISPSAGWALLGAGIVYTSIMLLYFCNHALRVREKNTTLWG